MEDATGAKSQLNLGGLYDRPGFLLRRCQQETGWIFEESCAELGLTQRQYDFLFALNESDELDQDHLARLLGLDRSNTGHVIKILLRKGYIERRVKPTDKRKRLVKITKAGRIIFELAKPAAEAARNYLLDLLNPGEQQVLMTLLRKIVLSNQRPDRAPLSIQTNIAD
jgi:DNA-binding MarR family transcriptional regulator